MKCINSIFENIMYIMSYFETIYNLYLKQIVNVFISPCLDETNKVWLIKNNILEKSVEFEIYEDEMVKDYDFGLYISYDDSKKNIFYIRQDEYIKNMEIKPCKKHFISAEIIINDSIFEIDLTNENYFIIYNKIFDEKFIKFYLNYYHNIQTDDYNINIVDNNLEVINIDKNKYILIQPNNYEVKFI